MVVSSHIYTKVKNTQISLSIRGLAISGIDTTTYTVMSAIKITSKISKLIKYNEAIANPIHNYQ